MLRMDHNYAEMYNSGLSLQAIAETAGLSVGTVVARLEALGVPRRRVGRSNKYSTKEEAQAAAEMQRKARYLENQEEMKLKSAARYQAKRDQILAADRAKRAADPEKYKKKNQESYARHRDARLAAAKRYGRDNPGKRHGISSDEFEALRLAQGGLCAICLLPPPTGKRLCVDHDHETGTIRGLLCSRHNLLLGMANDSPSLLKQAAIYLERHGR